MRTTEVLLRDHVKDLGRCGDVVQVKAGYARNYLLPNRLAVEANDENKKVVERRRVKLEIEEAAVMANVQKRLELLSSVTITTTERADDHGHLYGSVSSARIVELLLAAGQACKESEVRLARPIKSVGTHEVTIHVHADHSAAVTLEITAEG